MPNIKTQNKKRIRPKIVDDDVGKCSDCNQECNIHSQLCSLCMKSFMTNSLLTRDDPEIKSKVNK